jgi:hypothetical protein
MTIEERTPCGNKIAMTFGLTAAEMRVAGLIAEGKNARQVARHLAAPMKPSAPNSNPFSRKPTPGAKARSRYSLSVWSNEVNDRHYCSDRLDGNQHGRNHKSRSRTHIQPRAA